MTYYDEPQLPGRGGPPAQPAWPPTSAYPVPSRRLHSLTGPAVAIQVLLAVQAVATIALIVAALDQRSVVDRIGRSPESVTLAEATSVDDRFALLAVLAALLYVATGVVWIVWLCFARLNVRAWDAPFQRSRWGWAIAAWFIPIVNIFAPAMITKDVADGTDAVSGDISGRRWGQPVVLWWGLAYALMSILTSFAYVQRKAARGYGVTVDDVQFGITWTIVAEAATLAAIGTAIPLVRSLTRRQRERLATSPAV